MIHTPQLVIVSWLWSTKAHKEFFDASDVDRLDSALRYYYNNLRHVCITDAPESLRERARSKALEVYPLWTEHADLGGCYRRLSIFNHQEFNDPAVRYVSIDLDCKILNDPFPLFDRTEDLVLYRSNTTNSLWNGSLFSWKGGTQSDLGRFDPVQHMELQRRVCYAGTDQAWLSHKRPDAAYWSSDDGVLTWKHFKDPEKAPTNSKIIFFPGSIKEKHTKWNTISTPFKAGPDGTEGS